MLNDATCFKAVYIVCGYTDLRSGMDRLAALLEAQTGNRPYVPDTLYLFCGRRTDRIKGLVWEGTGWLLLAPKVTSRTPAYGLRRVSCIFPLIHKKLPFYLRIAEK